MLDKACAASLTPPPPPYSQISTPSNTNLRLPQLPIIRFSIHKIKPNSFLSFSHGLQKIIKLVCNEIHQIFAAHCLCIIVAPSWVVPWRQERFDLREGGRHVVFAPPPGCRRRPVVADRERDRRSTVQLRH